MTVSLTVVVKSRNPSTVLVLSGPLGSSAKPPDATWMASGSAAAELTETLFQMTVVGDDRCDSARCYSCWQCQHGTTSAMPMVQNCMVEENWHKIGTASIIYAMSHAFIRT